MLEKIKEAWGRFVKAVSPYKKNLIIPLLKIFAIIIVCALIAHFMGGNETLSEYAEKHPDLAYSSVEVPSVSE